MTGRSRPAGDIADAVLAEAARHGDLYAWERIVRRYQESVYRVTFLIVRDTALAESATQTAFLRAYRALPSYQDDVGLLPWLFRIAAGEARQQRRESGRPRRSSRPLEKSTGPRFPASSPPGLDAANGLGPAEREALGVAFDRLGEEDRLTLATRYLFDLSAADAAQALSIASGLVDEHLHSALRNLRMRMAGA
jgi:RNA polymerase sigma-70 factor (ECF subfamily)